MQGPPHWPDSVPLDALQVTDAWAQPIAQAWEPGEHTAQERLAHFADEIAGGLCD